MTINLLPKELGIQARQKKKKHFLFLAGILYLLFFMLTAGNLLLKIRGLEQKLQTGMEWEEEMAVFETQLAKIEDEISQNLQKKHLLTAVLQREQTKSKTLISILQVLPDHVQLKEILLHEEGWVQLRGRAHTLAQVGQFMADLRRYQYFSDVYLAAMELEGQTRVAGFQIEFRLTN